MSDFFQPLETRTLFSAHAVHADPVVIAADRQQILADIQKWRDDKSAGEAVLEADRDAIKADKLALEELVKPLRDQYLSDHKDFEDRMAIDRAAQQSVRDLDLPAILADREKLKADEGNSDALVLDHAQLEADIAKFRTDMAPFEQQTRDDKALYKGIFANDLLAIREAKNANSAQLELDCAKLKADQQALRVLLCADVKTIKADTKKLHDDRGGDSENHEGTDKKVEPKSKK